MNLNGKNAIITGGAIRIGRAITLALAQAGCNVFIHYNHSTHQAEQVRQEAEALGVSAWIHSSSFTHPEAASQLMNTAIDCAGQVDVLINNAALFLPGDFLKTDLDTWEIQFQVNLRAPFLLSQAFAGQLPEDSSGCIINIADANCLHPATDHFAYRLTKTALVSMTEILALQLAPRIRVNAVALGVMMPLAGAPESVLARIAQERIPLQRSGSAKIAAENVLHLIQQDFITGTILKVDGGENL